ncbi:hypothetical protein [Thermincola potens]|uniref:Uncharacterized protein n=1 Tax=Thermincola potens (strain JR) TaxID=635013 RepID=D5X8H6_THEPJ|nr:hypothetical protein [Thermincola potens]ADG82852.1 conserved hypothetical protein [Thermincola potens JR]
MDDTKVQVLYDHYKDTFAYLREYLKLRDKLFLFVLIVITAMFLQITLPTDPTKMVSNLISAKLGVTISLDKSFLDSMLWFALVSLVLRYFQTTTLIERQYDYLHKLEDSLTVNLGEKLIYREGTGYLENYPLFSSWAHFLYTVVFPILLISVVGVKIFLEIRDCDKIGLSVVLDTVFSIMILVSTALYLRLIHCKK